MSKLLKAQTAGDLFKHLAIMLAIVLLLMFLFFFVYLPSTTNHGETITVPKITGMSVEELEDFLGDKDLNFYVNDSTYQQGMAPFTVITQDPKPGEKVKQGRKIYVSINMKNPPLIKMPKLIGGSVQNAEMILKSYDLNLGEIKYVPDLAQNSVLRQYVNGREIQPGDPVAKGSRVDLEVGDGLGNTQLEVPSLVGMPIDEATMVVTGQGLKIGAVIYMGAPNGEADGTVLKQRPVAGEGAMIRAGELIDLWVAGPQPVAPVQ
ncbi:MULTISPECIES: PASTA domain-containing protein [Rufibacter]|uniref:Beta-lactam-binding protein with PASTA domain n=1 Tax=Rufibacter quisquiliarum TaxID=1549639 RepID=A0A839GUR9_9BACT|nr:MULTISPECIES: PASTA domain-containing protein [Rufibacter]MBA9077531.1 beta-lactam-binding protein with PASTA domain [Rufibacter quisquiliarum]